MPKEAKELTPREKKFIELLFTTDDAGFSSEWKRLQSISKKAGYAEGTNPYTICANLQDHIVKATRDYNTIHMPKAMKSIVKVLENPSTLGAKNMLDAADKVLDRGGFIKQDKLTIETEAPLAIGWLPPKKPVELPDTEGTN